MKKTSDIEYYCEAVEAKVLRLTYTDLNFGD